MLYEVSLLYKRDSDFSAFDVMKDQLLFKICLLFFLGTAYFHQKEWLALTGSIANWVIPSLTLFFPKCTVGLMFTPTIVLAYFYFSENCKYSGWGWFRKCRGCRICLQVQT